MKHLLVTLFAAILYPCVVLAQVDSDELQRIHLHDGSVFIGKVVEENFFQVILVATTGDTLHINKGLISKKFEKKDEPKFFYSDVFFGSIDLNHNPDYGAAQIDLMAGYRIDERYSFGVGFGIHQDMLTAGGLFATNRYKVAYGTARRYFFLKKEIRPFVFTKAGHGFADNFTYGWEQNVHNGGFYSQTGIGLQFASRTKIRFFMSLSQHFQHTTGHQQSFINLPSNNPVNVAYDVWHSNVIFKIGMEFQ